MFPDGNVYPIVYSVVEYYSDWASTDYIMSHELFETYTDPILGTDSNGNFQTLGWSDDANDSWPFGTQRELGDMCVNHSGTLPYWVLNGEPMAQLWSQKLCNRH